MQIHTRDLTADLLAAGTAGWAIDSGLRGHNLGYLIVGAIFAVLASLDMARHLRASRSPRVETLPAAGRSGPAQPSLGMAPVQAAGPAIDQYPTGTE